MTSGALALGDVLAANGEGFEAPGLEEFYPEPIAQFSVLGLDFEITRITLILWVATWPLIAVPAVARPASRRSCPASSSSSARAATPWSGTASPATSSARKGLPFAPVPGRAVLLHPGEQPDGIIPFAQISPNSKFAFPLVLAAHLLGASTTGSASASRASARYFKDTLSCRVCPRPMYILVTPIEILQNFVIRPFTLAVRLFANMFAGHMLLAVFALGTGYLLPSATSRSSSRRSRSSWRWP